MAAIDRDTRRLVIATIFERTTDVFRKIMRHELNSLINIFAEVNKTGSADCVLFA